MDEPCRLLELPRELRNAIYVELVHDDLVPITKRSNRRDSTERKGDIYLNDAPIASVLRVCKQIHDEYSDVCFKNASIIVFPTTLSLALSSFCDLARGVRKALFKHIKFCHIHLPYYLLTMVDPEEMEGFLDGVASGESEEITFERDWTPSKHAVAELSDLLKQLAKWVPEKQAFVGIEMMMSSGDAVNRFEYWAGQRLIQAPTFSKLRCDQSVPFARDGKVDIRFSMAVPVASHITAWDVDPTSDDDGSDDASSETPDQHMTRMTDDGSVYETQDSEEVTKWFLHPLCRCCHAHSGWCGFRIIFAGVIKCCHH